MATTLSDLPTSVSNGGMMTQKAPDERKEALVRAVLRQVSLGARVDSQSDYQAILVTGHRPNPVLRLVTLGFWGGEHRTSVSVDESGNTNIQTLSR
jgi:hypothetical protein